MFDESRAAELVAAYLGTDHETRILSMDEGKKLLLELPLYYDEPMADPSAIATMLVSRMAREHVTVALSGDAGDELFCGYNTYAHFETLRKLRAESAGGSMRRSFSRSGKRGEGENGGRGSSCSI